MHLRTLGAVSNRALFQEPFVNSTDQTYIDSLTAADREILSEGLCALLRERSVAYEIAAKVALAQGLVKPDVSDFGLPDILRLSRVL
jgi:hypothetical protein